MGRYGRPVWTSGTGWRASVIGYGWLRLLPLVGALAMVGLMHTPELRPGGWDWVVAVCSAGLVLIGGRWPFVVTLTQSALLVGAVALLPTTAYVIPVGEGVVQLLSYVALGELALRRRGWPTWCGAAAVAGASYLAAYPHYSPLARVVGVVFAVGLSLLLGWFLRSMRELARQAAQQAEAVIRSRDWELTAARAAERGAISRELHDVVAHHVAAIVLRAGVARRVLADQDPRTREVLDDVHTIGGQALADLRGLIGLLRDPGSVEDPGLLSSADLSAALQGVLHRTRQAGVAVNDHIDDHALQELDTVCRHAVLRVVQEGLTNVLKHAGPAATVTVAVRARADEQVITEVVDDGGQATTTSTGAGAGHGLIVMRERVELIGGRFDAGARDQGWAVRAVLPPRPPSTPPGPIVLGQAAVEQTAP